MSGIKTTKYCAKCKEFKYNVRKCSFCKAYFCQDHIEILRTYTHWKTPHSVYICKKCNEKRALKNTKD